MGCRNLIIIPPAWYIRSITERRINGLFRVQFGNGQSNLYQSNPFLISTFSAFLDVTLSVNTKLERRALVRVGCKTVRLIQRVNEREYNGKITEERLTSRDASVRSFRRSVVYCFRKTEVDRLEGTWFFFFFLKMSLMALTSVGVPYWTELRCYKLL